MEVVLGISPFPYLLSSSAYHVFLSPHAVSKKVFTFFGCSNIIYNYLFV